MKYLIVDDEHELYQCMYADLFRTKEYEVEEIKRMQMPDLLKPFYRLHFSDRINRRIFLPLKGMWNSFYALSSYPFKSDENYCVIFLNGSLRYHYSIRYFSNFKKNHPNVKLAMILYDSFSNFSAKRSINMIPVFDFVFSFDQNDCKAHGLTHIYSTFSKPDFVSKEESFKSKVFFIGYGTGRLELLTRTCKAICRKVKDCSFYIAGVKEWEKEEISGVVYNQTMPYREELQRAYNTDCILEVVREGQSGITLRTCEAIAFQKKLITNNPEIKQMPFYHPELIQVFERPEEIDADFIHTETKAVYDYQGEFSPLRMMELLQRKCEESLC